MDLLFLSATFVGIILISIAFIGCLLPVLSGPPLSFLSLLLLKLTEPTIFTSNFLIIMGIITIAVYFLDFILPIFGAKIYKASKIGICISIIGMLVGLFFFPPFGMVLGLLLGTILGELLSGKAKSEAIKIGFISFGFSLLAILIKVGLVGVMTFYFVKAIFQHFI